MQLIKKTLLACLLFGAAIAAPLALLDTDVASPLANEDAIDIARRDAGASVTERSPMRIYGDGGGVESKCQRSPMRISGDGSGVESKC